MNDSRFFQFLNDYPVFPINGFITNTLAFIPIFAMLYIANVAPLHNNCRYIICVWALTYGGLYIVQLIFAKLDYDNPTGYMPLNMVEPPYRFNLYEWHVRITTYSSSFEIALSVERMVATIDPKHYHSSKTAWKTLIFVTILMMFTSYEIDAFVHSADHFVAGCILQAAIEVLVVLVGCIASRVCRVRYESMYGKATLNERYQVKEAYEMSKAMIPALIASYFLKTSTIVLLYAYFSVREEYPYFISYLEAYYYTIYTINGTFSLCILLLKHPQLRKQTNRKLAPLCGIDAVEKISTTSNSAETEIYFTMLSADWKLNIL
ncbi:hypothetical protein PRIPAC_76789 [Pristionchus pacificus]|uniref:Uncharacterized protein n=1 Tax=Pristionchus pacificus TaxID=54126 RepID=A0A454Y135_PRIPA|nr:hypothetical protein PRIPAC_76789 [Pristionchus pacificus]|eukprot:PDM79680.1 hypothetical protein PRIPAC_32259 [Pristionchus pacificus]